MGEARSWSRLAGVTGCSIFLAALVFVLLSDAVPEAASSVGRPAPGFAFADVNPASPSHGRELALGELVGDRGLVLQFVASWCEPCRDELPGLQRLHESGQTPIVLVAADEYGRTENLLIVAERSRLTTPILFVPEERAEEMERLYDHEILPATYLIDREGRIREIHEGAWSAARLAAAIDRRLG